MEEKMILHRSIRMLLRTWAKSWRKRCTMWVKVRSRKQMRRAAMEVWLSHRNRKTRLLIILIEMEGTSKRTQSNMRSNCLWNICKQQIAWQQKRIIFRQTCRTSHLDQQRVQLAALLTKHATWSSLVIWWKFYSLMIVGRCTEHPHFLKERMSERMKNIYFVYNYILL